METSLIPIQKDLSRPSHSIEMTGDHQKSQLNTFSWITSRLRILFEVFHSPEIAFSRNLAGPSYLVPFVLFGICSVFIATFQLGINLEWAENQMLAAGASNDQIVSNLRWLRDFGRYGLLIVPVLLMVKWTLMSALLWVTAQLVLKDVDYSKILTVVAYSNMAIVARDLVVYIIILLRGHEVLKRPHGLDVAIGLNLLFPSLQTPWNVLTGNVNIFEAWYILLLSVGLAKVTATSWQRGTATVLPNWIFVTLVQVTIVSLGLKFNSGFSM